MPSGIYKRASHEERFWKYTKKSEGCWIWTASKDRGYGQFSDKPNKTLIFAHRFSWELHYGPIPIGKFVCHHCDNRACVNPEHLFIGTQADNMKDASSKDRMCRGERRRNHKLTDETARLIKQSNKTQASLSQEFGIDQSTIFRIKSGKRWKHI